MTFDAIRVASFAWPFDFLKGCFGTTITPTDVDGMVERHGRFLFFEFKSRGVTLKDGQRIAFERLSALPGVTVVVLWGAKQNPRWMQVYRSGTVLLDTPTTVPGVRRFAAQWFAIVEKEAAYD